MKKIRTFFFILVMGSLLLPTPAKATDIVGIAKQVAQALAVPTFKFLVGRIAAKIRAEGKLDREGARKSLCKKGIEGGKGCLPGKDAEGITLDTYSLRSCGGVLCGKVVALDMAIFDLCDGYEDFADSACWRSIMGDKIVEDYNRRRSAAFNKQQQEQLRKEMKETFIQQLQGEAELTGVDGENFKAILDFATPLFGAGVLPSPAALKAVEGAPTGSRKSVTPTKPAASPKQKVVGFGKGSQKKK